MEHPFIDSTELSKQSIENLQDTISSLLNKLTYAHRTGNRALINQLEMALSSYRGQLRKKMDELLDKQKLRSTININSSNKNN